MWPFPLPKIENVILAELDIAQRELLKAETGLEYAKAMREYRQQQVLRLSERVALINGVKNAQR